MNNSMSRKYFHTIKSDGVPFGSREVLLPTIRFVCENHELYTHAEKALVFVLPEMPCDSSGRSKRRKAQIKMRVYGI